MNYNGQLIQAQILRDCVGKGRKSSPWDRLLPILGNPNPVDRTNRLFYQMPSGSLLSETFRGKRIGRQIWHSKTKYFNSLQKQALEVLLTRDIGITRKASDILVNRPIIHFKRIEEFISGLVDSLWLANEQVFLENSQDKLIVRNLVRAIFYVGTYNLCDLVDQWKEWGNNLFHTLAETCTIGQVPLPKKNNIFRRLDKIPYINRVYCGDKDMLLMQHVAHLISSRQMPYMGKVTEEKAREKFKNVLQSSFEPEDRLVFQLSMAARRIGGICRSIRPRVNPGASHISVTGSGEFGHPISDGGQAMAVVEAMRSILLDVSTESFEENTPFGIARHWSGIPLWKTLFREVPIPPDMDFLQEWYLVKDQPGKFRGLDEVTGIQILYVAWRQLNPIPVLRAEVVPEMGNKARHVTLSDYWLNVLQSPLSHLLIDAMMYHPSVFSSFHRQDQTWEAVKGMCAKKELSLPKGHSVLSSDLKDATNAQQWSITIGMLRGFITGYGLSFRPDYVELVLSTIGPRLVLFSDSTSVLSKVGIMMGEAIAKPSLTLLNLSIEELAYLDYNNSLDMLNTEDPAPYREWRYLHIGGDDHLAMGPNDYLDLVTNYHLRAGSHISPGQHGYSRICVKYTERLVNLQNLQYKEPFNREDYSRSIIVDSVKVRLLERGQSTMLKKDNKNVAIGKSEQLGGCLQWLPTDNRFWTYTKKASIRALFVERMGSLLPRQAVNPRAFAAIHLPSKIGGYGLGLKEELQKWLSLSPEPHRWLISKASIGINVRKDLKIFRKLNTNTSSRGVESILDYQQRIVDQLNDYPTYVNAISWWELKQQFPDPMNNAKRTIALAADANILSVEEFAKRVTRGNLFQELLLGKKDLKVFNTRKYVDTYRNIVWRYCEQEGMTDWEDYPVLTSSEIATVIDEMVPQWYFDISQMTTFDIGTYDPDTGDETYEFVDGPYDSMFTKGLPSLSIPPHKLGIKINR